MLHVAHGIQQDRLADAGPHEHEEHEGGTCNVPGIAGLGAAIRFIEGAGIAVIGDREAALAHTLLEGLRGIDRVGIYGSPSPPETGVVSFRIEGFDVALTGALLDQRYGIAVRTGLHCAPGAHRAIGTFPEGTVRASLGPFNTEADVAALVCAVREIAARE